MGRRRSARLFEDVHRTYRDEQDGYGPPAGCNGQTGWRSAEVVYRRGRIGNDARTNSPPVEVRREAWVIRSRWSHVYVDMRFIVRDCLALAAAGLPALGVSACGSGSSSSGAASVPATASGSPPPAVARPAQSSSKVSIAGFAYGPATVTVAVGAVVHWTNTDAANHTVTADKGAFALGNLNKRQGQSFHFTKAGVYAYHCDYHPFMHGIVIVK